MGFHSFLSFRVKTSKNMYGFYHTNLLVLLIIVIIQAFYMFPNYIVINKILNWAYFCEDLQNDTLQGALKQSHSVMYLQLQKCS